MMKDFVLEISRVTKPIKISNYLRFARAYTSNFGRKVLRVGYFEACTNEWKSEWETEWNECLRLCLLMFCY